MEYFNFIIMNLILLITMVTYFCLMLILVNKVIEKPTNIFYYKIYHIFFSVICSVLYISFFIIFLYSQRLFNISNVLDLKILVNSAKILYAILTNFSYLFNIYFGIYSIIIIINVIAIIMLIHKNSIHHIFKLYLFLRYNTQDREKSISFFEHLQKPYKLDLISYSIVEFTSFITQRIFYLKNKLSWISQKDVLSHKSQQEWDLYSSYLQKMPWYHCTNLIFKVIYNKYYAKFFIPLSPLFFIIYDCFFNNLIIIHVYYYLLIYIPLMLWRRITIFLMTENMSICELFWDILYKDETCVYALPINHKQLFDIYIANGLRCILIPNTLEGDLHLSMYMQEVSKFKYNSSENCYQNLENIEIREPFDNIIEGPVKVNCQKKADIWHVIIKKNDEKTIQ